eukprot:4253608-Amphidinium_carterae.1
MDFSFAGRCNASDLRSRSSPNYRKHRISEFWSQLRATDADYAQNAGPSYVQQAQTPQNAGSNYVQQVQTTPNAQGGMLTASSAAAAWQSYTP